MEIKATILKVLKTDYNGDQILLVKLNNENIKSKCTVREGEDYINPCAGCNACSCDSEGLFVVTGNKVQALNQTGKKLKSGDLAILEVSKKLQYLQFFISFIVPTIFAVVGFILFTQFFCTELFGIIGVIAGLILGVVICVFYGKIKGNSGLPQVKKLL